MAIKLRVHAICPLCGQVAARREGDRIRGWHDCPQKPPGPPTGPINFHMDEVTFVEQGVSTNPGEAR